MNPGQCIAKICLGGHLIDSCANQTVGFNEEVSRPFCRKCGSKTIMACPLCDAAIPGEGTSGTYRKMEQADVPGYCSACGELMPWTRDAVSQAAELIDLIDELNEDQKAALKSSIPDLVVDSSKAETAAIRTGKLMAGLEAHYREAMKQILYSLLSAKIQAILKGFGFHF